MVIAENGTPTASSERVHYGPVSIEPSEVDDSCIEVNLYRQSASAFRVLGCLNNLGYVIMLASAKSLSEGGAALVFLVNVVPGLCVKISAPYWFDRVSYSARIRVASGAMGLAFFLVGFGAASESSAEESKSNSTSNLMWQLLGVALVSFQCGLGEATLLALAGRCQNVSSFSSGTGIAGPAGFAWNMMLSQVFGWSLRPIVWVALVWAGVYWWVYEYQIAPV